MTVARHGTVFICLLALCMPTIVHAAGPARHGEHEAHGGTPLGFKYLPLPPGPHVAGGFFTPTPESKFPYDAQISVIIDKSGPDIAIDTQYNRVRNGYKNFCVGTSDARALSQGTQNNYPYGEWLLTCDTDKGSGKPKFSVIKTVVGQSFTFVYEYDVRAKLDDTALKTVKELLDAEMLCDDTSIFHPCGASN